MKERVESLISKDYLERNGEDESILMYQVFVELVYSLDHYNEDCSNK